MKKKRSEKKEELWHKQGKALRDPIEILCGPFEQNGLIKESLHYKMGGDFVEVVEKLGVMLFITREYEHLILSIDVEKGALQQTFMHLPHPSGLAINRDSSSLYIAATRNPNQIWEFKPVVSHLDRIDYKNYDGVGIMMPGRVKYIPGAYYFHDLALIGNDLYANSVGQNAVVKIDLNSPHTDPPVWWPKCVEQNGNPNTKANYIQMNSIAAGNTLLNSYFSASSDSISRRRPGHLNYPVDKRGVVFFGATGDVFGRGLTRPHSARLLNGRVWVDNSGYGEFGYIEDGWFRSIIKLPGWTRGLTIIDTIAFVGISRVIPKFSVYAPGLKKNNQNCAIYAIDINTGKILGWIQWPYGNQIFSIDWIERKKTRGFLYTQPVQNSVQCRNTFYGYQI